MGTISPKGLKYAAHIGKFYLTCREYYSVAQISAPEVRLDEFTRDNQINFVEVFLNAYGCPQDPVAVVEELEKRGFQRFMAYNEKRLGAIQGCDLQAPLGRKSDWASPRDLVRDQGSELQNPLSPTIVFNHL